VYFLKGPISGGLPIIPTNVTKRQNERQRTVGPISESGRSVKEESQANGAHPPMSSDADLPVKGLRRTYDNS